MIIASLNTIPLYINKTRVNKTMKRVSGLLTLNAYSAMCLSLEATALLTGAGSALWENEHGTQ